MNKMIANYRRDIDGLRAIAILSVFFFHLEPSWMPGGYNGVDIFFVISGYLISSHLYKDLSAGRFSFKRFYLKRILRILPALIFIVLFTLVFGSLILLPDDLTKLSSQSVSSLLSVSNYWFYFNLDTSYFAVETKLTPLLHTWSLAVEEQFYLFFPMLLFVVFRYARKALPVVLLVLFLTSLIYSQWLTSENSKLAYYSFLSRGFELLIGAGAALIALREKKLVPAVAAQLLSVVALIVVCYSIYFIDASKSFPGVNALYATLATAVLIVCGKDQQTWVGKLIGNPVFVFIGLISYSLYLAHWPVFAYLRYLYGDLSGGVAIAAVLGAFALALFSYYFVEKKFRYVKLDFAKALQGFVVLPLIVGVCYFGFVKSTDGFGFYYFDTDYQEEYKRLGAPARNAKSYRFVCQESTLTMNDVRRPSCLINSTGETKTLLWGDSNAAHFVGMLGEIAKARKFSFRNITHSACPPVLRVAGDYVATVKAVVPCQTSTGLVERELDKYERLIITAQYDDHYIYDGFWEAFESSISELTKTHEVVLIGQIPRMKGFDKYCALKNLRVSFVDCDRNVEVINLEKTVNDRVQEIAAKHGAKFFNPMDFICPDGECRPSIAGTPLYNDPSHLNHAGSVALGKEILRDGRSIPFGPGNEDSEKLLGQLPWDDGYESAVESLSPLLIIFDKRDLNTAANWNLPESESELVFRDNDPSAFKSSRLLQKEDLVSLPLFSLIDRNLVVDLDVRVDNVNQDVLLRFTHSSGRADIIMRPSDRSLRLRGVVGVYESFNKDQGMVNFKIVLPVSVAAEFSSIDVFSSVTEESKPGYTPTAIGNARIRFNAIYISRQSSILPTTE